MKGAEQGGEVSPIFGSRLVIRVPKLSSLGMFRMPAQKLTLAGLEPAIFGSEDQRLIH